MGENVIYLNWKNAKPLPKEVNLRGCQYRITHSDGLVVFGEASPIWGQKSLFSFEQREGYWYVSIDGTGDVMASHITRAHELIIEHLGDLSHELK